MQMNTVFDTIFRNRMLRMTQSKFMEVLAEDGPEAWDIAGLESWGLCYL